MWCAILVACIATACSSGEEPTAVTPVPRGDIAAGGAAFLTSCATCHASRDGFDLALFGFPEADVVRRARPHVDAATATDIAAYIGSLGVSAIGRHTAPFQPGSVTAGSDQAFWAAVFGSDGIGRDFSAEQLRAIDLRRLNPPMRLLPWSSEADDGDWLPVTPLAPELLNANGNALRSTLDAYYAGPSVERLLQAIAAFTAASRSGANAVCAGVAGNHPRAAACFEARRWMSSLAAVHFLRAGQTEALPIAVVDLWWETGEAAVTLFFQRGATPPRLMVFGWLYLAYTYAPHRFAEENGYLGQFLQSAGFPRLGAFTALRRMVDPGVARNAAQVPGHVFWDAYLAITRAPRDVKPDVFRFTAGFLNGWLADHVLDDDVRDGAARLVRQSYDLVVSDQTLASPVRSELEAARDELLGRLGAAARDQAR